MSEPKPRNRTYNYARPLSEREIERGHHRVWVGGKWEVMGSLQRDYLADHGLLPSHRLLDVGCGALRAGIHFVEYLDPGNYYGFDINATLLDVGYDQELPEALREKLPRDHLRVSDRFECDFGVPFDYAIAQSVFTHMSLNDVRLCLYRVGRQLAPDGRFFATFFEAPEGHPIDGPVRGSRWTEQNPFFYYRRDLKWAADGAGLTMKYIGDWGHPAGQQMVEFRRKRPAAARLSTLQARARRLADAARRRL